MTVAESTAQYLIGSIVTNLAHKGYGATRDWLDRRATARLQEARVRRAALKAGIKAAPSDLDAAVAAEIERRMKAGEFRMVHPFEPPTDVI